MRLQDFFKLTKRHFKLIVILPLISMLISAAISFFSPMSYTAEASLVTNGDVALSQGFANEEIVASGYNSLSFSVATNAALKQVVIRATGPDPSVCIQAANAVLSATESKIKSSINNVVVTTSEAITAGNNSGSLVRSLMTACVMGLVLALLYILIADMIKSPIKSKEDARSVGEFPILASIPSTDDGERLLANLIFSNGKTPSTIAVVPVGPDGNEALVCSTLARALDKAGIRVKVVRGSSHARKFNVSVPNDASVIVECAPICDGMGAAYISNKAEVTIVCVTEWVNSKYQLSSTLEELSLANAEIAGLACVAESYHSPKSKD